MTRADAEPLSALKQLESLRLSLVSGYASSKQVMALYPAIKPFYVATPIDGLRAVASNAADAYVGVLGVNTFLANKYGISNLKVNAAFDMAVNGQRIGVRKDSPIKSIDDIVKLSKEKRLTYSSTSPNNVLPMFQMAKLNGANLRWIVFSGGSESVLQAVGGHVDMTLQSATEMKPQIESGACLLYTSDAADE